MKEYEEKIKKYMQDNHIPGEHLKFSQSCHSVEEAALAAHASADDFVKNICLIDSNNRLIVAIIKGEDKVSQQEIATYLKILKPKFATPDEILQKTNYPCGGVPSFGYDAIFLIDDRVLEKHIIYSGGGSQASLIKISTTDLQKANKGIILKIRK